MPKLIRCVLIQLMIIMSMVTALCTLGIYEEAYANENENMNIELKTQFESNINPKPIVLNTRYYFNQSLADNKAPFIEKPEKDTRYYNIIYPYIEEGYTEEDYHFYVYDLKQVKNNYNNISVDIIDYVGQYLTEEEIANLNAYESTIRSTRSLLQANTAAQEIDNILIAGESRIPKPIYSSSNSSNGNNYSGGVGNNFKRDGIWADSQFRYSWYSSNVLYHYRTHEWTAGSDGIYRDSAGRVCVASDDYALGTVIETDTFGSCVVTDTGVGTSGQLDVYTNF